MYSSFSYFLGLLTDTHVITTLRHLVSVDVVGSATLFCCERLTFYTQERTAAGPVNIMRVDRLVLNEDEDQFFLGKGAEQSWNRRWSHDRQDSRGTSHRHRCCCGWCRCGCGCGHPQYPVLTGERSTLEIG